MPKDAQQRTTGGGDVPVVFLDTTFRNRVIVFPGGDVLHVARGEVRAWTPAHVAYLESRPDFKRLLDEV